MGNEDTLRMVLLHLEQQKDTLEDYTEATDTNGYIEDAIQDISVAIENLRQAIKYEEPLKEE